MVHCMVMMVAAIVFIVVIVLVGWLVMVGGESYKRAAIHSNGLGKPPKIQVF